MSDGADHLVTHIPVPLLVTHFGAGMSLRNVRFGGVKLGSNRLFIA